MKTKHICFVLRHCCIRHLAHGNIKQNILKTRKYKNTAIRTFSERTVKDQIVLYTVTTGYDKF